MAFMWMKTAIFSPDLAGLDDLLIDALPLGKELPQEAGDRVAADVHVGLGQYAALMPFGVYRQRLHRGEHVAPVDGL